LFIPGAFQSDLAEGYMRSLNAADCDRPDTENRIRVRVSRGALAGVEGELAGEAEGDRLVVAVLATSDPTAETVPGLYLFLPRENVKATDG
jgi:hypothetical protein